MQTFFFQFKMFVQWIVCRNNRFIKDWLYENKKYKENVMLFKEYQTEVMNVFTIKNTVERQIDSKLNTVMNDLQE